jgi:acetyl esterase/lipase
VDDAVAAVEYVAALPYVDPTRIYMVGHSSGGTITLLTAESTDRLRAAFSLGGAPDMWSVLKPFGMGYGNTPFDWQNRQERRLRSATDYVTHLKTPTFFLAAEDDETYLADARKMEKRARTIGARSASTSCPTRTAQSARRFGEDRGQDSRGAQAALQHHVHAAGPAAKSEKEEVAGRAWSGGQARGMTQSHPSSPRAARRQRRRQDNVSRGGAKFGQGCGSGHRNRDTRIA